MFFSVLIPVYNVEAYLDRCLESLMRQTEKDFEVILVNDGSTDNSLSICKLWQSRFPETIKVINKPNTGSLDTRRKCLIEAAGEYIYFVDGDDYLNDPEALKICKTKILESNCDLLIFNSTISQSKTKLFNYPFQDNYLYTEKDLETVRKVFLESIDLNTLWNKVFSRNLVDWDVDYDQVTDIVKGTDFFQVIPIMASARRILYIDKVFYFYNTDNTGSISKKFNPKLYNSTCRQYVRLLQATQGWQFSHFNIRETLKAKFMSDVAKGILMMKFDKNLKLSEQKEYFDRIRNDSLFTENITFEGYGKYRTAVIRLLEGKHYYLLSLYIRISRLYYTLHTKLDHAK